MEGTHMINDYHVWYMVLLHMVGKNVEFRKLIPGKYWYLGSFYIQIHTILSKEIWLNSRGIYILFKPCCHMLVFCTSRNNNISISMEYRNRHQAISQIA